MFKWGIHSRAQFIKKAEPRTLLGRIPNISVALYDEIHDLPNAEELGERILGSFADERGAYKRTHSNRFETFDRAIAELLSARHRQDQKLLFLDMAVSDARTSCALFSLLSQKLSNIEFFASDHRPTVKIIKSGRLKIAATPEDEILEVVFPPFVFNSSRPEPLMVYPGNHLLRLLLKPMIRRLMNRHAAGELPGREVQLFSRRALALAKTDRRFRLGTHSILKPICTEGQAGAIRAMNILDSSYFTEREIQIALAHFHAALQQNGFFIMGSNQGDGSQVNGAFYERTPRGFAPIKRFGTGPNFGNLIDTFTSTR